MSDHNKSEDVEISSSSDVNSINIPQIGINLNFQAHFDALPPIVMPNHQGQFAAQTQAQSLAVSLESMNLQAEPQYISPQENNLLNQSQAKEDEKSEVKEEKKSQAKEDEKSEVKEEKKSQAKEDEKSEVKEEKKSQAKEDEKSEVKEEKKSQAKEEEEKKDSKSQSKNGNFLFVDEDALSKMGNNIDSLAKNINSLVSKMDESSTNIAPLSNNINSFVIKIGQSVDETKKLNDNYSSLISEMKESNENILKEMKSSNENIIKEMKSSNENTLKEIKALNENQVRLLNILAGKESPEKKDGGNIKEEIDINKTFFY